VSDLRTTPRQARSSATVDAILDAAEQVFATLGPANATTVDIAKAAGISVGRLYYWFPDKEAVVSAVMERSEALVRLFLQQTVVDDRSRSTNELVREIVESMAAFMRRHPGTFTLLAESGPAVSEATRSLRALFVQLAGAVIAERVPNLPLDEEALVAGTCIRIVIPMMGEYLQQSLAAGDPVVGTEHLDEARYLIGAYVYARYPANADPIWDNPAHAIQPSRRPLLNLPPPDVLYPALAPERGDTSTRS
jgi:AcrR family transcriptional regulator